MESEAMLTPREKSHLQEAQRRVEPTTLHDAQEQAQHTTSWAILGPVPLSKWTLYHYAIAAVQQMKEVWWTVDDALCQRPGTWSIKL